MTSSKRTGRPKGRTRRVLLTLAGGALALIAAAALWWRSLPDPSGLATRTPRTTALMDQRREEAQRAGRTLRIDYRPVSLDRISPRLADAVRLSEDASFFDHDGFDWKEIRHAAESNARAGRTVRGASTITQQLAKNLWLSPEKTAWRKLEEAVLTWRLERSLTKRRILELYLNVVQFGPGTYGAAAASSRYFGVPPSQLSADQAAQLAASLPRPSSWNPGSSSSGYARHVARIRGRMERATWLNRLLCGAPYLSGARG